MPQRRYSGPLRPGERSAKVYRSTKKTYTLPKYKKPARFRSVGYSSYRRSSAIARRMQVYGETKLTAVTAGNEVQPVATQVGSQIYQVALVTGNAAPSSWSGFTPIRGFSYPQSTADNGRIGRYMYLNHTTMNMSVHMNDVDEFQPPTQFRMIVFKARRVITPTGISYNPDVSLFLDSVGNSIGPGSTGFNGNDVQLLPTNKRNWIILKDTKFTLQSPLGDGDHNVWLSKYANYKQFRINLNHKRKVSFNNGAPNEPQDFDFHYGVLILSASIGRDAAANTFEVNYRGTTSAQDS